MIQIIKTIFLNFNYLKSMLINEIKKLTNERMLINEIEKKSYIIKSGPPNPELFDKYKKIIK